MIWGAAIAGAASIGAGLLANSGQNAANRTNIKLQREQLAWNERMANTAHQRQVADLRAAGLNPMLSVGGAGAATPTAPPAHVESTQKDASQHYSRAASSAVEIMKLMAETNKQEAETRTIEAMRKPQVDLAVSGSASNIATAKNRDAQTVNEMLRGPQIQAETKRAIAATGAQNAITAKTLAEIDRIVAEVENVKADTALKQVEAILKPIAADLMRTQADQIEVMLPILARLEAAKADAARAGVPGAQVQEDIYQKLLQALRNATKETEGKTNWWLNLNREAANWSRETFRELRN